MIIAEKHQNSTMGPRPRKIVFTPHHTTHAPISLQTQSTHAPLQATHVKGMKDRFHDEPAGKPTLRRPASGASGGGVITSKTNNKKATYSRAYGKGGTSSLPGGSSLCAQRQQQHQHRSLWMVCGQCLCGTRAEEWGSKLRQFLVGELPASLSLPTKIRIVLETRRLGHLWMIFQVVMTLISCAYFAITSAHKHDAVGLFIAENVFGASVLADLLLRFYASDHRKWFFLEKRAIVDILAIIPVFTDILRALSTNTAHETAFNTPAFLQAVQIFKLIRILRVFYVGRQFSSPAIRQGVILILAVVCIVYISACLINMAEGIPFGSAVYFSVVTLATVGYGDVVVVSNLGRFFVSCLICVSFIWLPYEINSLTQMLSLRSRYLTTFTPRAVKPNVLLVGHLDAAKLSTFLGEFFHPDRRTEGSQAAFYHVVILSNEEPDDELVEVLEAPLVESRVTFIKGTIMDEDHLVRAGANTAVACFVFNDGLAVDPEAADAITVLRVLVLKTFRPVLPCYVQLHHSQNHIQLHMLKKQRLVCIEDLKMSIMGLSALFPGFTTLLTNLLKSSVDQVADARWPDWQKEYIEGGQLEIYMVQLPESFSGLRFDKAARDLYMHFNGRISLIGVEERELRIKACNAYPPASKHYVKRVLINPGSKYRIKVIPPVLETWGYVLAGDRHTAELVQTLQVNSERVIPTSPVSSSSKPTAFPACGNAPQHDLGSTFSSFGQFDNDAGADTPGEGWQVSPCLLHDVTPTEPVAVLNTSKVSFAIPCNTSSSSFTSSTSGAGDTLNRAGLLESSSSLSPLDGAQLGDSADGMRVVDDVRTLERGPMQDHIVVLLPKAVDKIHYLLRPLRNQLLQGTGYFKGVVILTDGNLQHLEQQFQDLLMSPNSARTPETLDAMPFDLYVVEGQPDKVSDLRRAGIETAYTCILLADRSSVQAIDEEAVDEFVIHQFVTIEKLRSRMENSARRPLNYVVEVLSWPTLKILDQTYKTFKGKAKKHRKHRTQSHFSDLRDRLSMLRGGSPLRQSVQRSPGRGLPPISGSPLSATSPQTSPQAQAQVQRRDVSLQQQQTKCPDHHRSSLDMETPVSISAGGQAAVEFGVSHATLYPFVTAGTSFLIDVFDIISCQLFYNSDLIRFVDLLLTLDSSAGSSSGGEGIKVVHAGKSNSCDDDDDDDDDNRFAVSGRLGRIPMPLDLVGQVYGELYEALMVDFEAMPIALYRHDHRSDVSYVFTGPPPRTLLRATDYVFFLAPVETMKAILLEYGPR